MNSSNDQGLSLLAQRFGRDTVISLATLADGQPRVRLVNGYYEDGSFYTVTYALSGKMRQIGQNPSVALCGEWFTAQGIGENMGHPLAEKNAARMAVLRKAFAAWYDNGHTDESDPNTCILRVRLKKGLLFHHGTRYDLDFSIEDGIAP